MKKSFLSKNKNNLTPLYPYNGRASNLIDKFYIFGYNYLTLKKFLITQKIDISKQKVVKDSFGWIHLDEKPSILAEITNDYCKDLISDNIISEAIFPNNLMIYYNYEESEINTLRSSCVTKSFEENESIYFTKIDFGYDRKGIPISYRSTFSSHPLTDNNSKKCQNGFAYTFYRKFLKKRNLNGVKFNFYIPYTFCIISEFPFFNSFEKLFRSIRNIYSQKNNYIPIEILLHKIVTLTPSPINTDIIVDLESMCYQSKLLLQIKENNKAGYKSFSQQNIPRKEKIVNKNNKSFDDDFVFVNKNEIIEEEKATHLDNEIEELRKKYGYNIIKFKYLSGYPLIQYNLPKVLFYGLNIPDIITVFLFTFLENDVLFFSKNIEFLSFTLNAYLNLNYPLNSGQYYFNIGPISFEEFKTGNNIYSAKNIPRIFGINNEFVEDYWDKTIRIKEHLIVDLDNKIIIVNGDINSANFKKLENIKQLINDICDEKNSINLDMENTIIYQAIKKLYNSLLNLYAKGEKYFEKSFIYFNDPPENENEQKLENIESTIKPIQEAFYDCILSLSLYYYERILIKKDDEKEKMKIEFEKHYDKEEMYKKEELIIFKELMDTIKLQDSLQQFFIAHNPVDLYKVPLTFFEEFLSIISRKKKEKKTLYIKFFQLIDDLYNSKKKNNEEKIDFSSDIIKYFNNFKKRFDREIYEKNQKKYNYDYSSVVKLIDNKDDEEKFLRYQTYELDDSILLNYIHIEKNLKTGKYVQYISDKFLIEDTSINDINLVEIETNLINYCIDNSYYSTSDISCANIILLIALSLKYMDDDSNNFSILNNLFENFFIFKKYYSILLKIIYKTLLHMEQEGKDYDTLNRIKICFSFCFFSIRKENLVPNEFLMSLINLLINYFEKDDDDKNKIEQKNEIKNNDKKISKKIIYLYKNFTSIQVYYEKFIVNMINKTQKRVITINTGEKIENMSPKIRYADDGGNIIESDFISQREILNILSLEYEIYSETLDFSLLDRKKILDCCLNLIIYIRTDEKYEKLKDAFKTLKNILNIFLVKK